MTETTTIEIPERVQDAVAAYRVVVLLREPSGKFVFHVGRVPFTQDELERRERILAMCGGDVAHAEIALDWLLDG